MKPRKCASWSWHKGRKRPCRRRAVMTVGGIGYCEDHGNMVHNGIRPASELPRQWQTTQATLLNTRKDRTA